jgi:hypothetical protein
VVPLSIPRSPPLQLNLHPAQFEVFTSEARFNTLICGRRFGKTYLQITRGLTTALSHKVPNSGGLDLRPVVLFGMPTLKQCRRVLWKPTLDLISKLPPGVVLDVNRTEYSITLCDPYPQILFVGLNDNNGDRARGLRILHLGVDEVQDVRRSVLSEVLFPAMADTPGSTALLTGTPKGKTNHCYDLFQRGLPGPGYAEGWKSWNFPTWYNPFVPLEEVTRLRATLPPRLFEQELRGSFVNFEGQIFSEFDPDYALPPPSPELFSVAAFDAGDINPAWVRLSVYLDGTLEVTDSLLLGDGANAVSPEELARAVERFTVGVTYVFVDPSRPGIIMDLRRLGKKQGHPGLRRTRKGYNKIEDGLRWMQCLFFTGRLRVAPHLDLRTKLQSYHRATDKDGTILERVAEGQDDHEIDALRYAVATLKVLGLVEV